MFTNFRDLKLSDNFSPTFNTCVGKVLKLNRREAKGAETA
jgi:hypothetical protein